MSIKSLDPYTGKSIKTYKENTKKEINHITERAHASFKEWRKTSFKQRSQILKKVSKILLKNKKKYAELMTKEMGKPIKQSISEIEKCAKVCEYYAANAAKFLKNKEIKTEAEKSLVSYQPLGVILAVMPWNFPFWQVLRFAAPTLMAGNTAILKHASNVSGCSKAIEELFIEAGLPNGVFASIITSSKNIKSIIEDERVKAVTLTGSGPAGSSVASIAGKNIKKSVLELGGNDAYLILADANIKRAAKLCAESRLINSGQSCIGAKRFIVVEDIYDKFMKAFKKEMSKQKMGDPKKKATDIGPLAKKDLRDELHEQVTKSVSKGATIALGGKIPKRKGAFYPATILENVKSGMPAYHEELFGPVASVIKVKNTEEAISVANDSIFGLGSGIFSENKKEALRIAIEQIEAGACFINNYVRSDPRLPFGGIKQSGFGRELSSNGILEFVNTKTVYLD